MKNINEVRAELVKVFEGLKNGSVNAKEAGEMNNCAGKIINTLKIELEFAQLRSETPNIPFMQYAKDTGTPGSEES